MNKILVSPYVATDINIDSIDDCSAQISFYPFCSGYAVTLAHPIRRLLMGSTPGYSVVGVKIEGAKHEFDSIIGMVEDIAVFIVNLKGMSFKLNDPGLQDLTLDYSFEGHRDVKALDLNNDSLTVVDEDYHLASLTPDGSLKFSLLIKKGMGYVAVETFKDDLPEGFIPIDAFFSPVKKATYAIEKMLVNDDPTYEKVIFDIITDGQISPVDAFKNAISNMNSQMSVFRKIINFNNVVLEAPVESPEDIDIKDLMVRIEELNLSARSFNSLDNNNIHFLGQIILMSSTELRAVRNLGKKSYEEILEKVKEYNFTLSYPLSDKRRRLFDEELKKHLKTV